MAGKMLADARTGKNGRHALVGLLRQGFQEVRRIAILYFKYGVRPRHLGSKETIRMKQVLIALSALLPFCGFASAQELPSYQVTVFTAGQFNEWHVRSSSNGSVTIFTGDPANQANPSFHYIGIASEIPDRLSFKTYCTYQYPPDPLGTSRSATVTQEKPCPPYGVDNSHFVSGFRVQG